MRDPVPTTIHLKDYTPPAFLIETVDLDVDLHEDYARVRARLALRRNPAAADPRAPLVLDGDELELESAALDGRALAPDAYALDDAHLTIPGVPDAFTLETAVRIAPRKNTKLMGLYATKDGFFTQCEAEGSAGPRRGSGWAGSWRTAKSDWPIAPRVRDLTPGRSPRPRRRRSWSCAAGASSRGALRQASGCPRAR